MSGSLRQQAEDYLQMRRRLGYQLQTTGALVRRFADHCDAAGITPVTIQAAVDWAAAPADRSSRYRWLRLNAVRGFAGYLHATDPSHQVPAAGLLPSRYRRPAPYVLSEQELSALRSATATLRPHVQAVTYRTLITLLEVTGIRPCEAIRMESTDVDRATGVMTVHGKGGKQRLLPLHPTSVTALADYASLRDQAFPSRTGPGFFTGPAGTRLTVQQAGQVFTRLAAAAGLPTARAEAAPGARRRPTLVSLRHTFTVTTLTGWLSDGTSVEPNLPLLSAWLGHKDPRSTYWYYSDSRVIPIPASLPA
jgi:integrase/recombinase XerD